MSVVAAVSAGLTIAATAYQIDQQKEAAKEQKEAQEEQQELEQAIGSEKAARQRRQQVSQARVAQADIENSAAATGQQASSAAVVSSQNVTQQAGQNIGQINTTLAQNKLHSEAQQNTMNAGQEEMLRAQIGGQIANTSASIFSANATKNL